MPETIHAEHSVRRRYSAAANQREAALWGVGKLILRWLCNHIGFLALGIVGKTPFGVKCLTEVFLDPGTDLLPGNGDQSITNRFNVNVSHEGTQSEKQTRESTLLRVPFQRLQLTKGRFEDLTATR